MATPTHLSDLDADAPATVLEELKSFLACINPKSSRDAANALASVFPNAALALRVTACEPYERFA
ncbi:MAG: hypothetical protein AAGL49_01355 [Pseudomonadota bacterium]